MNNPPPGLQTGHGLFWDTALLLLREGATCPQDPLGQGMKTYLTGVSHSSRRRDVFFIPPTAWHPAGLLQQPARPSRHVWPRPFPRQLRLLRFPAAASPDLAGPPLASRAQLCLAVVEHRKQKLPHGHQTDILMHTTVHHDSFFLKETSAGACLTQKQGKQRCSTSLF